MSAADALAACAAEVRRADYDRYLSALFAPADRRGHLFALYAFHHEVAKTAERVREPLAGAVRLQWWRDALEDLYQGRPQQHPIALALAESVRAHDLPQSVFTQLIDARDRDFEPEPFADMVALEVYADVTSANLMRLAARVMGAGEALDAHAREIGIAYGLTGLLRAFPFHAARRHLVLPLDRLGKAGVTSDDMFRAKTSPALKAIMAEVAETANAHLAAARAFAGPGSALPALLPGALCGLYLRRITRTGFDPFRDTTDVPVFRRQLAMLRASWRGRI